MEGEAGPVKSNGYVVVCSVARFCVSFGIVYPITETSTYKSDPRFPPFLQYVRWKSGVRIKMIENEKFRYFSIKSYVVDVY